MHRRVYDSVKDIIRSHCTWLTIDSDRDRQIFYTNVCGQLKKRSARVLTFRVRQERGCFIVDRRIMVPLCELDTALAVMTIDRNVAKRYAKNRLTLEDIETMFNLATKGTILLDLDRDW